MAFDFKQLKKMLAEYKVYDAWQYVQSLSEYIRYMEVSYCLLDYCSKHRKDAFDLLNSEMFAKAAENPGESVSPTNEQMKYTVLDIAGFQLDDSLMMQKSIMEFFHYARIAIDILSQIINAALFGEHAFPVESTNLPKRVLDKLKTETDFLNLYSILNAGFDDPEVKYLMAFDNYTKHIKTILFSIKNSLIVGTDNEFSISGFTYKGTQYPKEEDAVKKAETIYHIVLSLMQAALSELLVQIPHCLMNSNRFQTIKFKGLFKEKDDSCSVEYFSFFLEVPDGIASLGTEIAILPLIVKPNGEVFSTQIPVSKVFLTKDFAKPEFELFGVAEALSQANSNEQYKKYSVRQCGLDEYYAYTSTFTDQVDHLSFNHLAMEGEMVFVKDTVEVNDVESSSDSVDEIPEGSKIE